MIPSRHPCLVLVQAFTKVDNGAEEVKAWTEWRQVWVSIQPDRGREIFSADEREAVVTWSIRGDFLELDGVEEKMRVIYNEDHAYAPISPESRVFDIAAVMPNLDGRDDIMLKATEAGRRYSDL